MIKFNESNFDKVMEERSNVVNGDIRKVLDYKYKLKSFYKNNLDNENVFEMLKSSDLYNDYKKCIDEVVDKNVNVNDIEEVLEFDEVKINCLSYIRFLEYKFGDKKNYENAFSFMFESFDNFFNSINK